MRPGVEGGKDSSSGHLTVREDREHVRPITSSAKGVIWGVGVGS